MTLTIGILGTGDMGSAVGQVLLNAGHRVVTALEGRSAASRDLASNAGLEDLGTLSELIAECDIFLSILPPALAFEFATTAAELIERSTNTPIYADCNAVAPESVQRIAGEFERRSIPFIDVGIVGPAPRVGKFGGTRFYVAGYARQAVLDLGAPEIANIDMGARIGRASALKMCYAALNKGANALYTNVLLAARRLDVETELMQELAASQPDAVGRMTRRVPFLAADAARFAGEMAEIAASFDAAGVSGDFYRGAEWVFRVLAKSSLAAETRATQPAERSLDEALTAFNDALGKRG